MNKDYFKKLIIVDFDDTLCLHGEDKTNIQMGLPNIPLIDKLNELYKVGYNIEIRTARGHFSAKDRVDAERKYKPIIKDWLHKYNVPFDKLSFNKPYGIIYIDDKAMRPNELHLLDNLL